MLTFQNQFHVIAQAFFFGCFLELLYEFHSALAFLFGLRHTKIKRISARITNFKISISKKVAVAIWDFFYFLTVSPICAVFLYGVNNGIVRWYIVLATVTGFICFKVSVGRIVNFFLDLASYWVKQNIFLLPLNRLKRALRSIKLRRKHKGNSTRTVLLAINKKQG